MLTRIEINTDTVIIDGRIYRLETSTAEKWGRKEIADYLGFRRKDGSVNMSNLYAETPDCIANFPNFEMHKCDHNQKPWTKDEVLTWLAIPKKKRIQMYKESLDEQV